MSARAWVGTGRPVAIALAIAGQRRVDVAQQPRHRPRAVVEQIAHVDDGVVPGQDGQPLAVPGGAAQQAASSDHFAPRTPPSTNRPEPSTKRDSSEARYSAAAATSSGRPRSPVSWRFLRASSPATGSS